MAEKIFKRGFASDFSGIDGEMSAIEPDTEGVNRAVNLEYAVGNSLRGRVGCQTSGSLGFFGIFPYSYTRTQDQYDIVYDSGNTLSTTKTSADGASITKLIGIGKQVFVLDTMNIPITQTNAGTYTWYSTVSGSAINLVIKKNGTQILSQAIGDGVTSVTNIYDLLATIDGLADLAVSRTTRGTCPPFAIVDGNQTTVTGASTTYGTRSTVTVVAGHNFYPGDIITFTTVGGIDGGFVISRTGTTITYVGPGSISLLNGAVLGYMGQSAASFPISTVSSEVGGVMTISFPYWRLIPEGDATSAASYGKVFADAYTLWSNKGVTANSFYTPPVSANADGCLYMAASGAVPSGSAGYYNNLIKTDGVSVMRAGLPTGPSITYTVTNVGAGGLTAGTYKYKAFYRKYDAQGNITDGPVGEVLTAVAVDFDFNNLRLTTTPVLYAAATGFAARSCYKYLSESPAAGVAFTVDDNSAAPGLNAFIQPGDPVCLLDNTAPVTGLGNIGTLHKTVCTFYDGTTTPSSIKVADSSGYTIANNYPISNGFTAVILRTTAGGNQYYKLCEIPVQFYAATSSFPQDGVLDTDLSAQEQYVEIEIGKEHNPPPPCSLVCQHQGGLVVARGITTPNNVGFSTADGIEYFPTASNAFDVPSTQSGFITAIASDTDDRLAVFKERAYYDVVGDLDGGSFSVNVKNEGDYGITSQASLVRVKQGLLGLSRNGYIIVRDGMLDAETLRELSTRVMNQSYYFQWAVAVNDSFNRAYICSIPTSSTPVSHVVDYSRATLKTFERSYATQVDQVGGMAMVGDTLYHLSASSPQGVFRRLIRFSGNSPGVGDGDSYIDNVSAISYILEGQPINFGEPGQLKTPIRIRTWSIPNDYVVEGWIPFSLLVETAASSNAVYIGGSNPGSASTTISFATENDLFKDVKVPNVKTHFYIVRFTTNTIRTAPFITGYEILFAANYAKEDFVK